MELRNGKCVTYNNNLVSSIVFPPKTTPIPVSTNSNTGFSYTQYMELTNNEKSIIQFLQNIIDYYTTIINNKIITEDEQYISKIRIFRELYHIIDFYNLKSNPNFSKFITVVIVKANRVIIDLNDILLTNGYFGRTRISTRNQKMFITYELRKELEIFIGN